MRLRTSYIEDETLSLNLRMFTALEFVSPVDIISVFNELKENTTEEAQNMIPYMERTYVGSTTYASHCKPDGTLVRAFPLPSLYNINTSAMFTVNIAEVLMI